MYKAKRKEKELNETVGEKRRRMRMKKGMGMVDGEEETWITKSIEEMTPDEYREYNKINKKWSIEFMNEEEKVEERNRNKSLKNEQRFSRYPYKMNKNENQKEKTIEERMERYLKWQNKEG